MERLPLRDWGLRRHLGYESYGFSAANEVKIVRVGRQPFGSQGNVINEARIDPVGAPKVAVVATEACVEERSDQVGRHGWPDDARRR